MKPSWQSCTFFWSISKWRGRWKGAFVPRVPFSTQPPNFWFVFHSFRFPCSSKATNLELVHAALSDSCGKSDRFLTSFRGPRRMKWWIGFSLLLTQRVQNYRAQFIVKPINGRKRWSLLRELFHDSQTDLARDVAQPFFLGTDEIVLKVQSLPRSL